MIITDSSIIPLILAAIITVAIFIIFYKKKSRTQHKDHNLTLLNPEYTSHPIRELTKEERNILLKNALHFSETPIKTRKAKSTDLLFYIVCISVLSLLVFFSIDNGDLDFKLLLYLCAAIVTVIVIYGRRFNYFIDMRSPIFSTTGSLYNLRVNNVKFFYVKDIDLTYFLDDKESKMFEEFHEGTLITIDYSPHSKFVWRWEKYDPKNIKLNKT